VRAGNLGRDLPGRTLDRRDFGSHCIDSTPPGNHLVSGHADFIILSHALLRTVQKYLFARGMNTRHFAIVGVNELGFQLARNVLEAPEMGLRLQGYYDDRPEDRRPHIPAGAGDFAGSIEQLVIDAKIGKVDRIYIAFPDAGGRSHSPCAGEAERHHGLGVYRARFLRVSKCSIPAGRASAACRR